MTVSVTILNALRRIPPAIEQEIFAGIDDGISRLGQHTDVGDVDVVVHPSTFVAPETGVSGVALGPENCTIYFDPENPNASKDARQNLAALTVHEVHHVLRMKWLKIHRNEDWTVGQVLILEGMATQAELFFGFPESPATKGISYEAVAPLLERAIPVLDALDRENGWINEPSGLPDRVWRAAYAMGHHVVGRYCERTGENVLSTIATPWREVWDVGIA